MKYEIENGYCIVPDDLQYTLALYKGKDDKGRDRIDYLGFYSTPEAALEGYIRLRSKKALQEGSGGDLRDMVRILLEETNRLESIVKTAFEAIKIELNRKEGE